MERLTSVKDLTYLHEAAVHRAAIDAVRFSIFLRIADDTRRLMCLPPLLWSAPLEREPNRQLIPVDQAKVLKIAIKQDWEKVRKGWVRNDAIRRGDEPDTLSVWEKRDASIVCQYAERNDELRRNWQHLARIQKATSRTLPTPGQLADGASSLFASTRLETTLMRGIAFPTVEEADIAFHAALMGSGWNPSTLITGLDATLSSTVSDPADSGRIAALNKFKLEEFQSLTTEDLLLAQTIAGHGDEWGIWKTPITISPGKLHAGLRYIDLAKRLRDFLAKEAALAVSEAELDALVENGVLHITRLALLQRLAPTSGQRKTKIRRLKPSSLANYIYNYYPKVLARAIQRKAKRPDAHGLFACLTEEDVAELGRADKLRIALELPTTLAVRGWWSDLPPQPNITRTTNPRGVISARVPEDISGEYQPIPDEYLAEIGPRLLWLICDLGPNLLPLLETLATCLESLDWSVMTKDKLTHDYGVINKFIARHLSTYPWKDSVDKPLQPGFPLVTGMGCKNQFEWPPRNFKQLKVLSVTLQSAHLFLSLLASAGRIGEVESLRRSCVTTLRDGKDYIRGWTYKLSGNLFGDARQWPAPAVLVQALGYGRRCCAIAKRKLRFRCDVE